jgi:hypothetical protein
MNRVLSDDALHQLLGSLTSNTQLQTPFSAAPHHTPYHEPNFPGFPNHESDAERLPSHTGIDWFALTATEDTVAESTPYDELAGYVAQKTLDYCTNTTKCSCHASQLEKNYILKFALNQKKNSEPLGPNFFPKISSTWLKFYSTVPFRPDVQVTRNGG